MGSIRREIRRLTTLATPVALTQLSAMLLWTVDLLMVGRLGVVPLNAVSLGRMWLMGTTICASGLIFGLDPIASQAQAAISRVSMGRRLVMKTVWFLPILAATIPTSRPESDARCQPKRCSGTGSETGRKASLASRCSSRE